MDDPALLQRYTATRDEAAFTELVQRHLGLVYHTALRRLNGDAHHAHDVSQTVFTLLARKAPSLIRHPTLTGWLHATTINTARDLIRAEQRRIARENETHAMEDKTASTPSDESWQQLRPVIDEALSELNAADRDALLLRYFEDQPLAHVATTLRLSEDAARMRVNRALEKLRTALKKRGVFSTATAVGAALTPHVTLAAPAGLAAHISSAALASIAIPSGTSASVLLGLKLMSTAKSVSYIATIIAALACGVAVYENQATQRANRERLDGLDQHRRQSARISSLEARLLSSEKNVIEIEEDNARLLSLVESAHLSFTDKDTGQEPALSREMLITRYKNAQSLARQKKYAQALTAFLWCYEKGAFPEYSTLWGFGNEDLLNALVALGKEYPPAMAAVRQYRETAEQKLTLMSEKPAFLDAVNLAVLNTSLNESQRTLALHDSLPRENSLRETLTGLVTKDLLSARRYTEIHDHKSFKSQQTSAQAALIFLAGMPGSDGRNRLLKNIADQAEALEVFAGVGADEKARRLAGQLLKLDPSAETRALVQKHLMRAGRPELLPP